MLHRAVVLLFLVLPLWGQAPQSKPAANPQSAKPVMAESAKLQHVRKLMRLQDTAGSIQRVFEAAVNSQIDSLQKMRPDLPAQLWTDFRADISRELDLSELMEKLIPIYDRHFTDAEVEQLIAFYETPVGRKLTSEMPQIQQEAMAVSKDWAEAKSAKLEKLIGERLEKAGVKPAESHDHENAPDK